MIIADPGRRERALNLAINAPTRCRTGKKVSRRPGQRSMRALPGPMWPGRYITAVTDTGTGMTLENGSALEPLYDEGPGGQRAGLSMVYIS
jgi:hypothetical protein